MSVVSRQDSDRSSELNDVENGGTPLLLFTKKVKEEEPDLSSPALLECDQVEGAPITLENAGPINEELLKQIFAKSGSGGEIKKNTVVGTRRAGRPRKVDRTPSPTPVKRSGRKSTLPTCDEDEAREERYLKKRRSAEKEQEGPIDMELMKALGLAGGGGGGGMKQKMEAARRQNPKLVAHKPLSHRVTPSNKPVMNGSVIPASLGCILNDLLKGNASSSGDMKNDVSNQSISPSHSSSPIIRETSTAPDGPPPLGEPQISVPSKRQQQMGSVGSLRGLPHLQLEEDNFTDQNLAELCGGSGGNEMDSELVMLQKKALMVRIEKDEAMRDYYRLKALKLDRELGLIA